MAEPLRAVIAEDNYLVREGLRRLLEDSGRSRSWPASAARSCSTRSGGWPRRWCSPTSGCRRATTWRASRRPTPSGPSTRAPACRAVPAHRRLATRWRLFADGSAGLGYLLKDRVGDLEDLVHALREVRAGGSVIDPTIVDTLVAGDGRTRRAR